ncbi:MAG: hypothetical protein IKK07_03685, partial [Bacteroides sp.]|nr:hypothetical protein [Bacteroides sp.]
MLKESFLPAERTPRAHGIFFAELRCAFGGWVVSLSSSEHKKFTVISVHSLFFALCTSNKQRKTTCKDISLYI